MKKLCGIGLLMFLLLIPTAMIWWLVTERHARLVEVEREIGAAWGSAQQIGRIELALPYRVVVRTKKGTTSRIQWAHFLPATLHMQGTLAPQIRYRGIFRVPVYEATVAISGTFQQPDPALLDIAPSSIQWDQARLLIYAQTPRTNMLTLTWAGQSLTSRPLQFRDQRFEVALPPLLRHAATTTYAFQFALPVAGTQAIRFVPAGQETTVACDAPWADPAFEGRTLPDRRTVTRNGFHAEWTVLQGHRDFPQQWTEEDAHASTAGLAITQSTFGVALRLPTQMYQATERAVKYACLFILLTFVVFFLFEVFCRLRLHPLQYLFIGVALCVFYLLLLSTAEHLPFGWAYTIAAGSTVGLITIYSRAILGQTRRAWTIGGLLATLYAYLYILLQAEDYALLMGSIGLFAMLGLVMLITRRIDWYAIGGSGTTADER